MNQELDVLAKWFDKDEWPELQCPSCRSGSLRIKNHRPGDFAPAMTEWATEATSDSSAEWFDPGDIEGHFFGYLTCSNGRCGERVYVTGEYQVKHEWRKESEYRELIRVRTMLPPVEIVDAPAGTPDSVKVQLTRAAKLVWLDAEAAATALRTALERLMDEQGVTKTRADGKRMDLHPRIETWQSNRGISDTRASRLLLATKMVGNQGTHGGPGLSSAEILDTAKMIETALKLVYDTDTDSLVNQAERMIRAQMYVP